MLRYDDARAPMFTSDLSMQIRHAFIQKVYAIIGVQLLLTAGVSFGIMHLGVGYLRRHEGLVLGCVLLSTVISISLICIFACRPDLLRRYPQNYAILLLFTLVESIVVGLISVNYTKESVVIALAVTVFVSFTLTAFACQTSIDFTGCGPYLFVGAMCLCAFGFFLWLASFFVLTSPAFTTMRLLYVCGGALLFSCYMVYDTQLIIGGKHGRSNEFSIDDYVPAAISLYLDIVQLFLFLLRIFGDRR